MLWFNLVDGVGLRLKCKMKNNERDIVNDRWNFS